MVQNEPVKWNPGDSAYYHNPELDITLPVTILEEVECWYKICCIDGSTVVVRPSRLYKEKLKSER